jgi:CheY-like chemotaxis protein
VVLCTGYSEKIDPEKASELGIQGFLTKPVVMKELAELVRKVLDAKAKGVTNGQPSAIAFLQLHT